MVQVNVPQPGTPGVNRNVRGASNVSVIMRWIWCIMMLLMCFLLLCVLYYCAGQC